MDAVDRILEQWRVTRPDLDTSAMGPIGRLSRVFHHVTRGMARTFEAHGLNAAGFDVLATLRRSPPPHALTPGELMGSMMITSGTMTNRIDQLAKAGLVERRGDREDARRVVVRLTEKGRETVDAALADHVATQRSLLAPMSADEVRQLDGLLAKLLQASGG